MEMAIAFDCSKKIFVMNDLPDNGFHDELVMVKPICLEGDIRKMA